MLHKNLNDIDDFWKIIKEVRKEFLRGNTDPKCYDNKIASTNIQRNIDEVEKNFTTKPINQSKENITEDILQTGAEMFTYLNFCPPKLLMFYKKLLLQGSIKDIILAFTNMMKTRRNAEKSLATKLWNKIERKLKHLKYRKIDSLTFKQLDYSQICNKTKVCSEDFESLG